jgi:hypothetical protein
MDTKSAPSIAEIKIAKSRKQAKSRKKITKIINNNKFGSYFEVSMPQFTTPSIY